MSAIPSFSVRPEWGQTEAATEILRQLALAVLARALASDVAAPREIAALRAWLVKPLLRHQRLAEERLAARFMMTEASTQQRAGRLIAAAVLGRTLPDRMADFVARWRRPNPLARRDFGPDALQPLAHLAFAAPNFRLVAARAVRNHLGSRVLFSPDVRPMAEFSLPLLLTLATMALADLSLPAEEVEPLDRLGRQLRETEGWAGFWDVWLVSRIKICRLPLPEDLVAVAQLGQRLHQLPTETGNDSDEDILDASHPCLQPDWLRARPPWWEFVPQDTP